jgi:c-di-GMP-binding flagellar brake protein YcgR
MTPENRPLPEVVRLPLRALGLRTGMALQTRRLVEGASKKESQFFGAIEGKGVMVGPFSSDAIQTGLEEGEVCVVRGFTGQYEFSFLSKVLQTFEQPFAYALLAYPAQVDAHLVRQSMRIKTTCPTQVLTAGASEVLDVQLVDISMAGAMIKSPLAVAGINDTLTLILHVMFEGAPFDLHLEAKVCHSNKASIEDAYFLGLSFQGTSQQDRLVLNYLTQSAVA